MNRQREIDRICMLVVMALAVGGRIACLLSLREDIAVRVPLLDARYYIETAAALALGQGWPPGPHFMGPVYPFLLSGLFRVFPSTVGTVQVAQLVTGVATTFAVYMAARRFGWIAGLAGGTLYALCGPAIVYENQVLMEAFLALCLALLVWIAGDRNHGAGEAIPAVSGLLVGFATAGRPTFVFLLPLIVYGIVRGAAPRAQRIRGLVYSLAGFLIVVGPPTIHNWRATGRPEFVTASGGLNLYIGNNPQARGIYSQPAGLFLENDPTGARSASQMAGRTLGPDEASRFYGSRAWAFLRADPGHAAGLWIRKAGYLLGPDEVPQIESFDELWRDHLSLRIFGVVGFAFLLPLAMPAIFRRQRLPDPPQATRTLCAGVLCSGAVAHLLFFSTGRYRAALLPALAVLSGAGASGLVAAAIRPKGLFVALWPVALGLIALGVAPRYDRKAARAWELHQTGIRYDLLSVPRSSEEVYRQALAADPTLGESWHNLGASLASQGRTSEAISAYETALPCLGENPVTLYNLGALYGRMGMDDRALSYLDRSLRADPAGSAVRVDRGVALYRLGRTEEAWAEWRKVAHESPKEPSLGRTLTQLTQAGISLPNDLVHLAGQKSVQTNPSRSH